ncbi:MAG TPA: peptide-methionine (R)-S-oxide reductase MsrB [Acidimicrobiales bacterium]
MVRKRFSDDELRERLDPLQYHVTQEAGTERAFTGIYWDNHDGGVYRCVVCDEPLFTSDTKYESGTGWPSFWKPISDDVVETHTDLSHGMVRTEVRCATCGAHLGHLFPDGPQPTGERYCMNSAALRFEPADDAGGDESSERAASTAAEPASDNT